MRAEIMEGIDWTTIVGPGAPLLGITVIAGGAVAKDYLQERFRPTPEQQLVHSVKRGLRRHLNMERKTQRNNNNPQPVRFINGIASEWALLTSMYPSGAYSTVPKQLGVRNPVIHKFMLFEVGNSLTAIHDQYKDLLDEEPARSTWVTLTTDEDETNSVGRIQMAHSHTNEGIDFHLLKNDFPRQRAEASMVIREMARTMQRAL